MRHAFVWTSLMISASASAELRLPSIFADHLVLQRDREIPIWGWATAGQRVRVEFAEQRVECVAGPDGRWAARLAATAASTTPRSLWVEADTRLEIRDVVVGEVWLCSGQSNMEWSVGPTSWAGPGVMNWQQEVAAAQHPLIRFFDVKNAVAAQPREECEGAWHVCSPETVGAFSATGYFFGRALQQKLNVPIGLIGSNWGGTPIEAWTSHATIRRFPEFAAAQQEMEQFASSPEETRARHRAEMPVWLERFDARDPGIADAWHTPEFDEKQWATLLAPGAWASPELKDYDGAIWLRKQVFLPDDWEGVPAELSLGAIDDMDRVWVNGQLVGATEEDGQWRTPRRYAIAPGLLRSRANSVVVRIIDTGGAGGLLGPGSELRLNGAGQPAVAPVSLAGDWRYRMGLPLSGAPPAPRLRGLSPYHPSSLFNAMIAPLIPFAIRGTIWYQGESNRDRAAQYRELFPAMIEDWRTLWRQGESPFYYVQIAPFAYAGDRGEAAALRDAQRQTLARVGAVGMAVTLDIGDPRDIHPLNKQEVGRRLALWALAKTYGDPALTYSGPLYRDMRIEGDAIRLMFDHVDGGLGPAGAILSHFTIAGADRVFRPAVAEISGAELLVRGAGVSAPVAVRYAWGAADEPNLQNAAGLPASSFRTDDWE